jgi:acyl transferase domain-containing protein
MISLSVTGKEFGPCSLFIANRSHSIGEIAMGYASGHYDRETAIGIAVARAEAMIRADGNGAMVALGVGVQKAKRMVRKVLSRAKATSGLWIAGINSPQAVTVAGTHELVDAMIELANDPDAKVFNAKLRVTCAFHTPLMESQEQLFKERVAATPLSRGTNTPFARVMSTTDGKWLDRDLDVDYCWDNIRRPVLFGSAINKIISDESQDGVRFLEIAPHPVLKAYIEQSGGKPISSIRRPNPKVPAQNTGEQYQFLEGIGNLLSAGFKSVDFDKLCASPQGVRDFMRPKLPEYAYSKSKCWSESESQVLQRLKPRSNPIASRHFRINVETHPDLTGHVVFDAVLFPGSGYVLDYLFAN